LRYFFSKQDPLNQPEPSVRATPSRILFIESGSRSLSERSIPAFTSQWPEVPVDLLTCYRGVPRGFAPDTTVFLVTDYATPESRAQLFRQLRGRNYRVAIMICSAEPVMTKWKWMLALRIPAKFVILNENADYFWLHWENRDLLRRFPLVRLGLQGAGALHTVGRLLLLPFSLLFLLLYACTVHLRRRWRLTFRVRNSYS
jgi:hypothetical protein